MYSKSAHSLKVSLNLHCHRARSPTTPLPLAQQTPDLHGASDPAWQERKVHTGWPWASGHFTAGLLQLKVVLFLKNLNVSHFCKIGYTVKKMLIIRREKTQAMRNKMWQKYTRELRQSVTFM